MLSTPSTRPASSDLSFFSNSKSTRNFASTSSTVVVTTRIARRPAPSPLPSRPSTPSVPLQSSSSTKKRKSPSVDARNSLRPSDGDVFRDVKRLRTSTATRKSASKSASASASRASSRASSRQNTSPPTSEPIYRNSRSRSTSVFPSPEQEDAPINPRRWACDEDGTPGPGFLSSEAVVKRLMRTYKAYFRNPNNPDDKTFEPHPSDYPWVELEYPNTGASEKFILLAPKDKDHYNPIMCLERTLYTIIECYLTPEQQSLFGTLPKDSLCEANTPPSSPTLSPSSSPASSSSSDSNTSSTLSSLTSLSSSSSNHSTPRKASSNHLRNFQRAIHLQDGPLFMQTFSAINAILRHLKYPPLPSDPFAPAPTNILRQAVESWTHTGLPNKVLMRIVDENYQRSIGPHVHTLKAYEAFSSTVYGELMPSLTYEIVRLTKLTQDSLFLDLGSGVGNVLVQASLQSGCKSFGVELMPAPANLAKKMLEQFKTRCRMWGVSPGEVELEEGDMLKSQRVVDLIPKADVVLVDNKVFGTTLNEALRPKFLDLKEGAIVVSLQPFVSSLNARVTERNVDDISAIFDVTERPYHSGSVSWGNSGGNYYVHRVDREGYAKIRERFERGRREGRRRG